ncbi:FecR family protein [Polaribacter batillariae]|uniref:FecR family protein n=1 Tax=Polaribacter batillariae TaxID=2808900 RepID=A0ABX7SUG6_9FLAO|nr:FecR family protein [Polaribacter batillariae]QTD37877.1 FecR family protein [Polaribacter batillariae]
MKSIINKYLQNKATSLEKKKLQDWVLESYENKKIFKENITLYLLENTNNFKKINSDKAFKEFLEQINKTSPKKKKFVKLSEFYKYAAIIVVCASIFYFTNTLFNNQNIEKPTTKKISQSEKKAKEIVLTLEDGSQKLLQQEQEQISYFNRKPKEEVLVYNEIKVPKGQVFKLILSDSTVVWLNADSKLKYPKYFISSSKTRNVTLDGEAFFEVKSNKKKPFLVHANEIKVEVLGTKFNISSYKNDDIINTTLVEGSVNVKDINNNDSILLKPSFQASFQKKSTAFTSKKVNTLDYTSWINKKIIFNNVSFEKLVFKIERTYDVEIVNNHKKLKKVRFTGEFDVENIETIFKALSVSYNFKYTINKNKITIN